MSASSPPNVVVLAGPNGAGKSTAGPAILRDLFGITRFVNADTIAQGLSAFAPEEAAIKAAQIMLEQICDLADQRTDFAFETTLSSRTFASWLTDLQQKGYRVHVVFLWLPTEELALHRVADRVRLGGHEVPEEVVRRRYRAGLSHFLGMYRPLADSWFLYDNTLPGAARLLAAGKHASATQVIDEVLWSKIQEEAAHGRPE